jgi:hypothetical protein
MVAYDDGIFIDTAVPMDQLRAWLNPHMHVEQRKFKNFSDLHVNPILNGTGLGSSPWNDDNTLISVQGNLGNTERSRDEKSSKYNLNRPRQRKNRFRIKHQTIVFYRSKTPTWHRPQRCRSDRWHFHRRMHRKDQNIEEFDKNNCRSKIFDGV